MRQALLVGRFNEQSSRLVQGAIDTVSASCRLVEALYARLFWRRRRSCARLRASSVPSRQPSGSSSSRIGRRAMNAGPPACRALAQMHGCFCSSWAPSLSARLPQRVAMSLLCTPSCKHLPLSSSGRPRWVCVTRRRQLWVCAVVVACPFGLACMHENNDLFACVAA